MFERYSIIDLFGPFYGTGWHEAEICDGLTFRWSHPDANIKLPTLGARNLRIRWTLAFLPTQDQIETLRCYVGQRHYIPTWGTQANHASFWFDLLTQNSEPFIDARISISKRVMSEVEKAADSRDLGIAVNRVEVFAISEQVVGEHAQRISLELDRAYNDILAIRASHSWKLTAPVRWLRSAVFSKNRA